MARLLEPQLNLPNGQQPLGKTCSNAQWPFNSSKIFLEFAILVWAPGYVFYSRLITITASLALGPVWQCGENQTLLEPCFW